MLILKQEKSDLESELVTAVAEEMMAAEASQVPFPRHHAMDSSSGLGMLKLIDCMKLVYETDIWTQHRGVQYLCDSWSFMYVLAIMKHNI